MSKRTYVCFRCRTTERVPLSRLTRDCRKCHAPAEHVYYKFRIPKGDDDKGWAELETKVRDVNDRIKKRALEWWQAKAERYQRLAAAAKPGERQTTLRRRLREAEERVKRYERW